MIYCPNVYNQAAFNTWMDKKTFLLGQKPRRHQGGYGKTNTSSGS